MATKQKQRTSTPKACIEIIKILEEITPEDVSAVIKSIMTLYGLTVSAYD